MAKKKFPNKCKGCGWKSENTKSESGVSVAACRVQERRGRMSKHGFVDLQEQRETIHFRWQTWVIPELLEMIQQLCPFFWVYEHTQDCCESGLTGKRIQWCWSDNRLLEEEKDDSTAWEEFACNGEKSVGCMQRKQCIGSDLQGFKWAMAKMVEPNLVDKALLSHKFQPIDLCIIMHAKGMNHVTYHLMNSSFYNRISSRVSSSYWFSLKTVIIQKHFGKLGHEFGPPIKCNLSRPKISC